MASPAPLSVSAMSDEEFEKRTLDAIGREFGVAGIARFLMAYRSGHGDYTRDRHKWLSGITMEDIERDLAIKSAT